MSTTLITVEAETFYAPSCAAKASVDTFQLSVDGTPVATLTNLDSTAIRSLVIGWRQGSFCGLVGEQLLAVLALYAEVRGE